MAWLSIAWQKLASKISSHHTGPSSTDSLPSLLLRQSHDSREYGSSVWDGSDSVEVVILAVVPIVMAVTAVVVVQYINFFFSRFS